jgi:hypothetical protein
MTLVARIEGVGLVGPGLVGWREARAILARTEPYVGGATVVPAAAGLPPTERRRAGKPVRLALAAGLAAAADAGRDPKDLVAVFTSSTGDGDNQHAICEALASDDRLISPTRFHNSVHNAPVGYWSIATGGMRAADSLAAYDASLGAGLLEALGRVAAEPGQAVLLAAYDAPYPEPLYSARPIVDSFAVGLVLASTSLSERAGKGPTISVTTTRDPPTPLSIAELERVRAGVPAARILPLLERLAKGEAGRVVLEYLDGLSLAVDVRP